jgi:hypothetical protein
VQEELERAPALTRLLIRIFRLKPGNPEEDPVIRRAILQPRPDEVRKYWLESALRGDRNR